MWRLPNRFKGKSRDWTEPPTLRYKHGTEVVLPLVKGAAGFVLAHTALWYHEEVESLTTQPQHDEWGWAPRPIRGSSTISNHASGTAMDLNATLHPLGVATLNTFTLRQVQEIHHRLEWLGVLRWGGDYQNRPDAMHWEIDAPRWRVVARATRLRLTKRGRRLSKVNPRGKR
jgi:hypothetical protein